jgi:flagellar protein FlbD
MIELTRLNGRSMVVNSDLIKTAEASPDTMLTLINGEKLIVREEIDEVVEKVLTYRARLLAVVAKRLHHFSDLERAAALASLEAEGQPAAPIQMKQTDDFPQ